MWRLVLLSPLQISRSGLPTFDDSPLKRSPDDLNDQILFRGHFSRRLIYVSFGNRGQFPIGGRFLIK